MPAEHPSHWNDPPEIDPAPNSDIVSCSIHSEPMFQMFHGHFFLSLYLRALITVGDLAEREEPPFRLSLCVVVRDPAFQCVRARCRSSLMNNRNIRNRTHVRSVHAQHQQPSASTTKAKPTVTKTSIMVTGAYGKYEWINSKIWNPRIGPAAFAITQKIGLYRVTNLALSIFFSIFLTVVC